MNLFRRLWNLARALLRPRKPLGATEPEPPTVEDLRADIRVRLVIDEALADVAGWRLDGDGTSTSFTMSNGPVRFRWDEFGGPWLNGVWSMPQVNYHNIPYRVSKRAIRRASDAAHEYAKAERVRRAAASVARRAP